MPKPEADITALTITEEAATANELWVGKKSQSEV
jgi:hypothetical protein